MHRKCDVTDCKCKYPVLVLTTACLCPALQCYQPANTVCVYVQYRAACTSESCYGFQPRLESLIPPRFMDACWNSIEFINFLFETVLHRHYLYCSYSMYIFLLYRSYVSITPCNLALADGITNMGFVSQIIVVFRNHKTYCNCKYYCLTKYRYVVHLRSVFNLHCKYLERKCLEKYMCTVIVEIRLAICSKHSNGKLTPQN